MYGKGGLGILGANIQNKPESVDYNVNGVYCIDGYATKLKIIHTNELFA